MTVMSPVIQYGFAGFCIVLLLALGVMANSWLETTQKRETLLVGVIQQNTESNNKLAQVLERYDADRKNAADASAKMLDGVARDVVAIREMMIRQAAAQGTAK